MKLIAEWKTAYKLYSVQLGLLITVLSSLYALLPSIQAAVSAPWYAGGMASLSVLLVILRLVVQVGEQ